MKRKNDKECWVCRRTDKDFGDSEKHIIQTYTDHPVHFVFLCDVCGTLMVDAVHRTIKLKMTDDEWGLSKIKKWIHYQDE